MKREKKVRSTIELGPFRPVKIQFTTGNREREREKERRRERETQQPSRA